MEKGVSKKRIKDLVQVLNVRFAAHYNTSSDGGNPTGDAFLQVAKTYPHGGLYNDFEPFRTGVGGGWKAVKKIASGKGARSNPRLTDSEAHTSARDKIRDMKAQQSEGAYLNAKRLGNKGTRNASKGLLKFSKSSKSKFAKANPEVGSQVTPYIPKVFQLFN